MLHKLLFLVILLFPFSIYSQVTNIEKGAADIYTKGAPTGTPRTKYDSEWAINVNTSKIYRFNRNTNQWILAGSTIGYLNSLSAPTGAPVYGGPDFILNNQYKLFWWNSSSWVCINCSSLVTVYTDNTIDGDGSLGNPLKIEQQGASVGQVLKWDGITWTPSNDNNTTYSAGSGINITGTTITNTAPDQTITIAGAGINVVTGTYPNFTVTGTEVDGSITNEIQHIDSLYTSNDTLFISLSQDGLPSKGVKLTGLNDGNGIYGGSDTIPDGVYAFSDSSKTFGLGQFPSYPTITTIGTTQGFYYKPQTAVKILNGDYSTGFRNEFSLEPSIARVRALTTDNLNVTSQFLRALSDDSWSILQGTIQNDLYGDIQIVTKLDNDEELINLGQSGQGDTVGVSMFLGKGSSSSAYYNDSDRAWGVKSDLPGDEEFQWIKIHLPGSDDTISNTIKLYEKYYLPNEQPSVTIGDSSVIVWVGNGTTTIPQFLPYNSNSGGTSVDTSGYNLNFYIQSDSLYIEDDLSTLGVDLSSYLDNTDSQTLSIDSIGQYFILSIQNGNSISWDNNDADFDPDNEIQTIDTFNIVSDSLRLSLLNDGIPFSSVDLSPYLDNTDTSGYNLSFTLSTDTLYLEDGNSTLFVVLPTGFVDTDDQTLSIDSLVVTNGQDLLLSIENGNTVTWFVPNSLYTADDTIFEDRTAQIMGYLQFLYSDIGRSSLTYQDSVNIIQELITTDAQVTEYIYNYQDNIKTFTLQITNFNYPFNAIIAGHNSGANGDIQIEVQHGLKLNAVILDTTGVIIQTFDNDGNAGDILFSDGQYTYWDTLPDGSSTNELQTIDTFNLTGTTLSISLDRDGEPAKTVSFSGWDTDVSNDLSGSGAAPQVAIWSGTQSLTGSSTFTYQTNTLSFFPSSNDTIVFVDGTGSNDFMVRMMTDTFNGTTKAWKIGALNLDGRVYLSSYETYLQGALKQVDNKGIEFRGSTGQIYIHPNGDYYTGTTLGDNQTTNRNLHWYFKSGGIYRGNPMVFQHVFEGNDTTGNSFEFLSRNIAGGGITEPDSTLMRIGSWDHGTALEIKQGGEVGVDTRVPTRVLDINGDVRIRDLITTNPTMLVGVESTGVLNRVILGTGLSMSNDTLNSSGVGGDTNIYNTNGNIKNGGTVVDVSGDDPVIFNLDASGGEVNRILRLITDYTADDAVTNLIQLITPNDSLVIYSYDSGINLEYEGPTGSGTGLTLSSNTTLTFQADSIIPSILPNRTVLHQIVGLYGNTLSKIEGSSNDQVLKWDEDNGYWEIGTVTGGLSSISEGYIETSTATTIDLDANIGEVKDRDGSNIAFTLPSDLDGFLVFRNGVLQSRTGSLTTRDYSVNTGTNSITFVTALTSDELVVLKKIE